jgi:hypothetical protein
MSATLAQRSNESKFARSDFLVGLALLPSRSARAAGLGGEARSDVGKANSSSQLIANCVPRLHLYSAAIATPMVAVLGSFPPQRPCAGRMAGCCAAFAGEPDQAIAACGGNPRDAVKSHSGKEYLESGVGELMQAHAYEALKVQDRYGLNTMPDLIY